ncbi:proline--tRNA ligase [Desulfolucanica intricata]|uniref:proline--tRNA ligase n=1 Tax=Desulfolucanica intricata TaxID=1285191 RepID=UPI000833FA60|nr:proline--tRNA ligase [Desulfolucanica intricata]
MRASQILVPTLRETPAEAEVISHKLLLRAGFIRKAAAGVYTYLPLAQRVLKKIQQIIREEMDREGGQEILLPVIQPAELWQESGRWDVYGPELFRLKDRHGRDFALGPTHEEIITFLVKGEVSSYKQLPLLLYQIQNKYRDERRPRFGVLRGREFIMKDLYSFDKDEEGLDVSYRKMYEAYARIFKRCGLKFRPVEADSGAIGGSDTHEFMVLADAGEATVLYCEKDNCDYAANAEKAKAMEPIKTNFEEVLALEEVYTPGRQTITQVAEYLGITANKLIKTLFYETEDQLVAVLVRGDHDVNEIKLQHLLDCLRLELAGEKTVQEFTGAPVGYVGPVGLQGIKIIADSEVAVMSNAVAGANKPDYHYKNVNPGRDFSLNQIADIRIVQAGEPCPSCGAPLCEARGIEVGQVFKLGDKYSKAMGATFQDENGKSRPYIMGCYGIGVSRTMAAAIEQNHDSNGIVWPVSIAPFHLVIVPVNTKDINLVKLSERLYLEYINEGIEVVLDDRHERPGVKFKDADLIGYPLRLTIGKKALEEGNFELYIRKTGETSFMKEEQLKIFIKDYIKREQNI